MRRARPPYVHKKRQKGKDYYYFIHPRAGRIRIPHALEDQAFWEMYADLRRQYVQAAEDGVAPLKRPARETVGWVIQEYRSSPGFQDLSNETRDSYERMLEAFRPVQHRPIKQIERRHIQAIRNQFKHIPRTADEFRKVAHLLLGFAEDMGWIAYNPAAKLKKWNTKPDEYRRWTEAEHQAFQERHAAGPMRTAYELARWLGQRRKDVVEMTWGQYTGTEIRLRQSKTGKYLEIPVHPDLKAYLDSMDRADSTMMVPSKTGGQNDLSAFSKAFRRALKEAGLAADVYFHGLDKDLMSNLAEAGCTVPQMMAFTGRSREMCEHYAKGANQKLLANAGVTKLADYKSSGNT